MVAVEVSAPANQEFDLLLQTTDSAGAQQDFRLQWVAGQPPQLDVSTDTTAFTLVGKGASTPTWNDGSKHTWVLVLDGTRLLFYLDSQPVLDIQGPAPKPTASLTLASLNQATITGIRVYAVP